MGEESSCSLVPFPRREQGFIYNGANVVRRQSSGTQRIVGYKSVTGKRVEWHFGQRASPAPEIGNKG
jgi:hypothetical protein